LIDYSHLLKTALFASLKAGEAILEVYKTDFSVEKKSDYSPLTEADKRAHTVINDMLQESGFPVLSEEGRNIEYDERKNWEVLWIVDPLDGTKEFVKKNGEFTVNIALIVNREPAIGVIYVPVKDVLYFASTEIGSYKLSNAGQILKTTSSVNEIIQKSEKLPIVNHREKYTMVASRSHLSLETEEYIKEAKKIYKELEMVSMGSSLKFCLVAEGIADVYPRFTPTNEWDTAAGQAIVKFAGKGVYHYPGNKPMLYNKPDIRNTWFIAK
jgi:3'(2'), 5'-bisphosphate nucleotidase